MRACDRSPHCGPADHAHAAQDMPPAQATARVERATCVCVCAWSVIGVRRLTRTQEKSHGRARRPRARCRAESTRMPFTGQPLLPRGDFTTGSTRVASRPHCGSQEPLFTVLLVALCVGTPCVRQIGPELRKRKLSPGANWRGRASEGIPLELLPTQPARGSTRRGYGERLPRHARQQFVEERAPPVAEGPGFRSVVLGDQRFDLLQGGDAPVDNGSGIGAEALHAELQ